jgi:hypothetical protein
MKSLVLAFTLALLLPAAAQYAPLPRTGNLINNATKEVIGTVTFSGDRAYLRDKDGKHLGTVVFNADGTRTTYDENGKVIDLPMAHHQLRQ